MVFDGCLDYERVGKTLVAPMSPNHIMAIASLFLVIDTRCRGEVNMKYVEAHALPYLSKFFPEPGSVL